MKQVLVERFGGPETLRVVEQPTPLPGAGQVRIAVTSIGMNHADLMARRGEYKLISGEPPFTPGLECGGIIDAVGSAVTDRRVGQRVILGLDAPRLAPPGRGGTYRSHYLCEAAQAIPAPDAIPDEQLGAIWLTYLTAHACLVWKQRIQPGQFVAIPAASSGVGLAAAQVVRRAGAVPIGLTTSPGKVDIMRAMPTCAFEHIVVTRDPPWHQDLKKITANHGVNVFFDPVASGEFLNTEIRCLAPHGTIWVYGLLGQPGPVDVTPLIRKHAAIRGWLNNELLDAAGASGTAALESVYAEILAAFTAGDYRQPLARTFPLDDVQTAHAEMDKGEHVGKLVLVP